jgi:hypothetical protein
MIHRRRLPRIPTGGGRTCSAGFDISNNIHSSAQDPTDNEQKHIKSSREESENRRGYLEHYQELFILRMLPVIPGAWAKQYYGEHVGNSSGPSFY